MEPQTRRRLDTVLGWVGYSLSYTETDSTVLASVPMLGDTRASQVAVARRTPTAVPSKPGSTSTVDRREAAINMLEAFAEGLQVCARLTAQFMRAAYLYTSQRIREYRDRDEAIQSARDHVVRPSLRERLDDRLERVLDALETRALALNPMPAIRRARAVCTAGANERIDRMEEQMSLLATKLSPGRAFRNGREAVTSKREAMEAKVSAVTDGVTKRADQVADGVRELVTRTREASVDASVDHDVSLDEAPLARVRWPEPEPDHDQAHKEEHETYREHEDTHEEDVVQPIDDSEQDHPSFLASLRWSSVLDFLRPRERRVPSLFVDSQDPQALTKVETDSIETGHPGTEAEADEDRSVWPERSALERLEIMLSSNADLAAAPSEPEDSKGHEQR